ANLRLPYSACQAFADIALIQHFYLVDPKVVNVEIVDPVEHSRVVYRTPVFEPFAVSVQSALIRPSTIDHMCMILAYDPRSRDMDAIDVIAHRVIVRLRLARVVVVVWAA